MAIRFYCPFCDRLLGISQRKAGDIVECPSCHGKVGVPLAERFEEPTAPPSLSPIPLSPLPARTSGIVLTRSQMLALGLLLGLLLLAAFTAGLLVGALT
jgi:hypothetical protein